MDAHELIKRYKDGGRYFANANLSGADLRHANLSGVNLNGANLGGVNLEGAILKGAKVEGEQLAHVLSLRKAILPDGSVKRG